MRKRWKKNDIKSSEFSSNKLSGAIYYDLVKAYQTFYAMDFIPIHNTIQFFDQIEYRCSFKRNGEHCTQKIQLRVGSFFHIFELDQAKHKVFGQIRGIISHKDNSKQKHLFLIVKWLVPTGIIDAMLLCPKYCYDTTTTRCSIYSIALITNNDQICHFVHDCDDTCIAGLFHNENRHYWRNDFVYNAV